MLAASSRRGELPVFTRKVEVLISRSPEEVFAFIEDARNRPRWDDSVDSEVAHQLAGREGGTSLEFSLTGRPTGLLRLLQPMIARTTQKNLDCGFGRLKQVLESETTP